MVILFVTNYNNLYSIIVRFISQKFKANIFVKILGISKIPLLFFCRPKIIDIHDNRVTVKIKLNRKTKNHINSMYFGALAVGADLAGGYLAFYHSKKSKKKINLIFKDFHADFLKRAEGDVYFKCNDGLRIKELINKVISTGNRHSMPVNVIAYTPEKNGDDPIARFTLTLSLKQNT